MPYRLPGRNDPVIWPHSYTPGEEPGSLYPGQVAVNGADGKLFYRGTEGVRQFASATEAQAGMPLGASYVFASFGAKEGGHVFLSVASTTGRVAAKLWDGSTKVYSSQFPSLGAQTKVPFDEVVAEGPFSKFPTKDVYLWSCDEAGSPAGEIVTIWCGKGTQGNPTVEFLDMTYAGAAGSIFLTECYSLETLITPDDMSMLAIIANNAPLTYLRHPNSEESILTRIELRYCRLKEFNGNLLRNVDSFFAPGSLLEYVDLSSSKPEKIDLSGGHLRGMTVLRCDSLNVSDCDMTAQAINEMFEFLAENPSGGTINIKGNPGADSCDVSIATGKNYTVLR